jgi:hypothetical protein
MSRSIGPALPPLRLAQLGRAAPPDRALVLQLLTVDEHGFPHVALLGAWEVVAWDAATLRLAIGSRSSTAANLRRTGQATVTLVDAHGAHYVKVRAREVTSEMRDAAWNARFDARVEHVLADAANPDREGTSHIVHGIVASVDPTREPARAAVLAELREP